jgi:hypothetical protein
MDRLPFQLEQLSSRELCWFCQVVNLLEFKFKTEVHFQSASQGVRINELNVYGCNNGSIEFEPGDYYIEKLIWYGNCNLKVTGISGVARLFVKNGFVINQPACWNMAEGTCRAPLSLSSIQNQSPDRLSIRVYQGDVSVQGGAQVSAGLYVDKEILLLIMVHIRHL